MGPVHRRALFPRDNFYFYPEEFSLTLSLRRFSLQSKYARSEAFCGGIFVTAETELHDTYGFFLRDDKPDTIVPLVPNLLDCEYYPVDALPESYRILPLLINFLKIKYDAWYYWSNYTDSID